MCLVRSIHDKTGEFYGECLSFEVIKGQIVETFVGTVGAPGVLHDEIRFVPIVVSNAHDGHCMTVTLPADPVMLAHGT